MPLFFIGGNMASIVNICGIALSRIGNSRVINSLDEKSKEADVCSLHYEPSLRATLADFDWKFATKRVALADTNNAPSDWCYAYRYPTDCLRISNIIVAGNRYPTTQQKVTYEIGADELGTGKLIYTDLPNAWIRYVAYITDTNMFDDLFIDALAWRLAAEIAFPLTADGTISNMARQMYGQAILSAASKSLEENQEPPEQESAFVNARLS